MEQQKIKSKPVMLGLQDLLTVGLVFVVTGITLAFGLDIIDDVDDDFAANSAEANASLDTITAVGNLTSKLPTLATVVAAAIIIGVLVTSFTFRR